VTASIREPLRRLGKSLLFPIPRHLAQRHIQRDSEGLLVIEESLKRNYYTGWREETRYSGERFRVDLQAHVHDRLDADRRRVVPWLDAARPLRGARVLEIGCGTGSSTVALGEQGAQVIGIDVDEGALRVAEDRCRVYGVQAELEAVNAVNMASVYRGAAFDLIIFFACLEHMTLPERLAALRDAWEMLPKDGLLVVVETPNRLWYRDLHTSMLPFFHWLPDELAFQYARFSPRENYATLYGQYDADSAEHFMRRGRGVSFHEFDLAIKPARDLRVVSSLSSFEGLRYSVTRSGLDRAYKSLLRRVYPGIHEGFLDVSLYLIVRKD